MFILLLGEEFYIKHAEELLPHMTRFEREVQNPILRIVPKSCWKYTSAGAFLFKLVDRFDELIGEETRSIMEEPEKHTDRSDYFYYLISQVGTKYLPVYGTHMLTMTFAGRANVAVTIPWMFLHARRVPNALERMREELYRAPGERKPYVEACFRETARLYTGLTILRVSTRDTTVLGHTVPYGTLVACSPAASQRIDISERDGIYENAGKWDPGRFIKDPDAYQNWFQRAEFVHFGMGTHACPGERLARLLIFDLVLKMWMTRYDAEVVSGLQEGEKGIDGVGAEAAWTEENLGTPTIRGDDVLIRITSMKRVPTEQLSV